mgnify:CR=1 FL=1
MDVVNILSYRQSFNKRLFGKDARCFQLNCAAVAITFVVNGAVGITFVVSFHALCETDFVCLWAYGRVAEISLALRLRIGLLREYAHNECP